MVNNEAFSERLTSVIQHYELTAASFAERIGVQRSSISHLLSGRNKPSLDFVLKVLHEFPEVSLYWLMNGTGKFPDTAGKSTAPSSPVEKPLQSPASKKSVEIKESAVRSDVSFKNNSKEIERIVVFYKDGTFKNYTP